MQEITEKEMHVLEHTLGLDYRELPFRNNFVTSKGTASYPICEGLVAKKLMIRQQNIVYCATEKGLKVCQNKQKEGSKISETKHKI